MTITGERRAAIDAAVMNTGAGSRMCGWQPGTGSSPGVKRLGRAFAEDVRPARGPRLVETPDRETRALTLLEDELAISRA